MNKLISPLKVCTFSLLCLLMGSARAEYYVVYGGSTTNIYAAHTIVNNYSCCGGPRVVGAPYRSYYHYKKPHHYKHHYRKYCRARATQHSCYSVDVYPAMKMGPAYCNTTVVGPYPYESMSDCGRVYRQKTTEVYYYEEYSDVDGRATADDIYPELNIDN